MTPPDARPAPANPLADGVFAMWLCEAAIGAVLALAAAFALASSIGGALMPWLPVAALLGGVAWVLFVPRARHARWRWELHEEELDLLHGVWNVTRTIVPLTRIQHVAVQRTGWTRLFGVVVVHAYTAAGGTTLPGLEPAEADDLRDQILARLRTPDDL
ncbi:MAG: PH domain-containing protein [Actinobacteria bacterium]|nr:PH domain-containing protein [Actinomycetota bacterium]